VVPYLVSFATGTLLAGAFLGLLPEALEVAPTFTVMTALIVGLLGFFILERLVIWRHCHHEDCDVHGASGYLILVGDAFHNFMDGVAIGAAFAASPPLGISTALAVVAHEVPQEVGDFGILLNSGFSKGRAFALNLGSAATTIPGAVVAFFAFSAVEQVLGIVLALAASSFLYIALADLIPGLHREWSLSALPVQVGLIVLGVVVIMTTHVMAH
jgi:zinc and cadmium transporter